MNFPKDEVDVVIYHHPCNDGFASAFVIWLYYKQTKNTRPISFLGANYSDSWPNAETAGKNVLIADFSYPSAVLNKELDATSDSKPKAVIIIDHHKSAQKELSILNHPRAETIFNMSRSGCGLVWEFFFGAAPMPGFLAMIEDNDIWRHALPHTKQFITYLRITMLSFELFESLIDETNLSNAVIKGASYLEYETILIEKATSRASVRFVRFEKSTRKTYALVSHVDAAEFKSEIGNKLIRDNPIVDFSVVMQYNPFKNITYCSLRSCDSGVDVSEISKEFLGGGGHRNASGALLKGQHACISNKVYGVFNVHRILTAAKFSSGTATSQVCSIVSPSMQTQHPLGMYLLQKRYQTNAPMEKEINNATHLFALGQKKFAETKDQSKIGVSTGNSINRLDSPNITTDSPVYVVSVSCLNELGELTINVYLDSRFVNKEEVLVNYIGAKQWKATQPQDEEFKEDLGHIHLIKCVKPADL